MINFIILFNIADIGYFQNTRKDIRDELIWNFIENRLLSETQHHFVLQKADSATLLKYLISLSQGVSMLTEW